MSQLWHRCLPVYQDNAKTNSECFLLPLGRREYRSRSVQPQGQRPPVTSQSGPILESGSNHGLVQRLSNSQLSFNTSIASIFSQVSPFLSFKARVWRWVLTEKEAFCLQVPRLSGAGGISSQLQAAQHQQRSSQVGPSHALVPKLSICKPLD